MMHKKPTLIKNWVNSKKHINETKFDIIIMVPNIMSQLHQIVIVIQCLEHLESFCGKVLIAETYDTC